LRTESTIEAGLHSMTVLKRVAIVLVIVFIVAVFGLFAFNFYIRSTAGDDPGAKPPVIYERSDRPSRA
jgi:preprotein translocase subunit SecG